MVTMVTYLECNDLYETEEEEHSELCPQIDVISVRQSHVDRHHYTLKKRI